MAEAAKPYTFEDLVIAIRELDHSISVEKGVQDRWDAAKSALDSHQRDLDQAKEKVVRSKTSVRAVLANLEK